MHFRILTCVLLIITCAGLAYPSQLAAQDNRDRTPLGGVATQPINSTLLPSNRGTSSAAACTVQGRPCNPLHPTCCGSLKCVFRGGSTRVGYQCWSGTRSTPVSVPAFWEKLSETKLDPDLAEELFVVANSVSE
jgi:hypothetical protein